MNFALKKKMFDIPNDRSMHNIPTPHSGGIAIIISWYLGLTILYLYGIIVKELYYALLCGILIAAVSIADAIKGLTPSVRLVVHFITAIAAFYLLGGLRPLILPGIGANYNFLIYPIAIIGMVWFINLFNFMDGVDGFASTEAIIVCSVLFVLTWNLATILLIACISGFLYWNLPRAKIFMGDVGSTQLGFILVVLGIHFHNIFEFSILNWIMVTSPFWFDATLTLLRRWRNGERLSEAHRKHVYQRIIQAGFSHERVNLFLILINIIIVIMITVYREIKILQIPLFILTLALYYFITRSVDRKVPFSKNKV
jgi:UDP-N-acetylmuramyl pentapeptide phosphotransferase/UDP-N-acetylglucosamine-1-phosphate transferase